jgi:hypothetical protein
VVGTGSGPAQFEKFQIFQKMAQIFKFKMDVFHCSKNTKILYEARFKYCEKHTRLGPLHIPNIIRSINFGIDSNLNLL